mgnify:CR=1 FL=1
MKSSENHKFDWIGTGVLAAIVTILAVVAALVISKVAELVGLPQAIAGGGLLLVFILSLFSVTYFFLLRPVMAQLAGERAELSSGFRTLGGRFDSVSAIFNADWLITSSRLMEIEAVTDSKEIWIITRSLEEEMDNSLYGPIVRSNCERGVKYTYFVPNNPIAPIRVQKLKAWLGVTEMIECRVIPHSLFDIVSAQDIAIFGPTGNDAHRMKGYMNLPIKERGTDFFIELGPQFCEQIVAILLRESTGK